MLTSRASVLSSLKFSLSRVRVLLGRLTEVVSVFSSEVALSMVVRVGVDGSSKSMSSALNRSVLEGQISNIVFIDHAENWLLLNEMILRVLEVLVFGGFEFSESIVTNQVGGLLLGLAVVAIQSSGESTGSKAVQIGFFRAFDLHIWLHLVRLLHQKPVFVPVIV
jgi:hypothetical protein